MNKNLKIGACYRVKEGKKAFRVLWIYPENDLAVICRIESKSTRARRTQLSRLSDWFDCGVVYPIEPPVEAALPEKVRTPAVHAAFAKIKPALATLLSRGYEALSEGTMWKHIAVEAAKVGVADQVLNLAFSKVLMAGGVLEAAIPAWHKGGRRKSSGMNGHELLPTKQKDAYGLAVADYPKIAAGVRKFLRDGKTWQEAHDDFLKEYYPIGEKKIGSETIILVEPDGRRPSYFQFKYHGCRLVPYEERVRLQWGDREVDTSMRGKPSGQSYTAIYPGVVSEIDWTFTDNVAVTRGTRLAFGRLTLYGIVDVYTGYIQAAYVSLENASVAEAGRAVLQCLEDKVELCARYGLEITPDMWSGRWIPIVLRSDKGELDSWKSSGLATALGMQFETCPAKRPDLKGTIESFFNVVRYYLRKLPGGTDGHRERLADHHNVTAIYDFDQLQKLLFVIAIAFNRRIRRRQAMTKGMVASGVKAVPNELYKWGEERGCFRDFPIEQARLGVLPVNLVTLTGEGIKIDGLRFQIPDYELNSPNGIHMNDWLMRARSESWKVECAVDGSTVDFVWLRHRPVDHPVIELKCPLSPEHEGYSGLSWAEYLANRKSAKVSVKSHVNGEGYDFKAWMAASISTTTKQAERDTADAREGMSATKQIAGAEERREEEKKKSRSAKKSADTETDDTATTTATDLFDNDEWKKAVGNP